MANNRRPFYWKLSSANVMSDGMLKGISYDDYALMMAVKDRPLLEEGDNSHNDNKHNENQQDEYWYR